MSSFRIKIANKTILIHALYSRTEGKCYRFLTSEEPDFCIQISQKDIDDTREIYNKEEKHRDYPDSYIETIAIFHKIADKLLQHNTFVFHGAAIAVNDEAYIFSAKSGTGKTTHIIKWLSNVPDAYVINGDKPFINCGTINKPYVCGAPWAGKEGLYSNSIVPLKAIIFLERSEDNFIKEIPFIEAFPLLLQQVYKPTDERQMRITLQMLSRLNQNVSFYHYYMNNFKKDAFETAYNALINSCGA